MTAGDRLLLLDGAGNEFEAVLTQVSPDSVVVKITDSHRENNVPHTKITMSQAMLKDRKMDTLVRQLTELGMSAWRPFFAERSIPRPSTEKLDRRMARWRKIAGESIKQCRRNHLPEIFPPVPFKDLLKVADKRHLNIIFSENETRFLTELYENNKNMAPSHIHIMIGPEGGFASHEIDMAVQHGFLVTGLGPRILRAETAAIAAMTLIQHLWGDMG